MLSKSPEEIAAYSPANGFELLAKNLCVGTEKERDVAVRAWREAKETGREDWEPMERHCQERKSKDASTVIVDLPFPSREPDPSSN